MCASPPARAIFVPDRRIAMGCAQAIPEWTRAPRPRPVILEFKAKIRTIYRRSPKRRTETALWMAYQSYVAGDQMTVKRRPAGGAWSQPEALTPPGGDHFHTDVEDKARCRSGWCGPRKSRTTSTSTPSTASAGPDPERLTSAGSGHLPHDDSRDRDGNLYLRVYQSSRSGNFDIYGATTASAGRRRCRCSPTPPLTIGLGAGGVARWPRDPPVDTYAKGNYDVMARTLERGKLGPVPTATSGCSAARVSAQIDKQGRLWIA